MSPDTPADGPAVVLARWFRAFNDHDLDALVGLADPDIDVLPVAESASVPAGTSYHGHGGLRSIIGATYERFPAVQVSYELRTPHVGRRVTADLMFALDGDGSSRRAVCDYGIHAGHVHSIVTYDNEETRRAATRRGATLTTREREVLSLMASGRTVAEIAQQLHLSELTVRTHVRNAKDRLNARTTAHAIALAVEERALD